MIWQRKCEMKTSAAVESRLRSDGGALIDSAVMKRCLPKVSWAVAAVWLLLVVGLSLGALNEAQKLQVIRRLQIDHGDTGDIEHMCAPWKSDRMQFNNCDSALDMYYKCEVARLRMLDQDGAPNDAGVTCEHPVYQFHRREQQEIDTRMHLQGSSRRLSPATRGAGPP
jgi:hypothetical protein